MKLVRLLLAVVVGGVALAAPPSLLWEGELVFSVPWQTLSWNSTLKLTGNLSGWECTLSTAFAEGAWTSLSVSASGSLSGIKLSGLVEFDPKEAAFAALTLSGKGEVLGLGVEGVTRLEEKGFGWGINFLGPKGSFLERIRLRFNLKRFLDEVEKDTFAPSFSYGEAWFRGSFLCCLERMRGWVLFTEEGFSEFGLSFPLPLPRNLGILLSASLRFSPERKATFLNPGLVYDVPQGLSVFLGLDWDQKAWAIKGLKLYALGFRWEKEAFKVRALHMLEDIGLVKKPYREAVWLSWEGKECCGPLNFCSAWYFDSEGLFGLGEVDLEAEVGVGPGITLGFGAELSTGKTKLTLSWKIQR